MRYIAFSLAAFALAICLQQSTAFGIEVGVEVGLPSVEVDIGTFETELAPHGRWVDVEGSRAWQPAIEVTDTNWQPYLNEGHWVATDEGWYWDSTYAWGWAPFHYGRWDRVEGYNWVWTPGTTWAPAWVSWRESDSVYGWAPYGRRDRFEGGVFIGGGGDIRADYYHFVPAQSFLSINLSSEAHSRDRNNDYYKQTRTVNNSYTVNNNRVINNGIPMKSVATATRQEIKVSHVSDAKAPGAKHEAGAIHVYRPAVRAAATTRTATQPAAQDQNRNNEAKPVTPKGNEPRNTERPAVAPRTEEPKTRTTEPRTTENAPKPLHQEEPKARPTEPRATEPKTPEPRRTERPAAAPRAEEPKGRGPEPKAEEGKGRGNEKEGR